MPTFSTKKHFKYRKDLVVVIDKALKLLCHELNGIQELTGIPGGSGSGSQSVVLGNISQLDAANSGNTMPGNMVMTLVNMSEESSLKNMPSLRRKTSGLAELQNPAVHMNLYVLIVSNSTAYETALFRLAAIVKFFQRKSYFVRDNTSDPSDIMTISDANGTLIPIEYKLIVELQSPTIEELNNLWGMLGGKQLPSVLYRIRMVELDSQQVIDTVVPIDEVKVIHGPPPV
jgi:hypothetical protein